jgi:hypothetical protein
MTALAPASEIDRSVLRVPRAHLALNALLMQGPVWLQRVFDDSTLPEIGLLPRNANADFRSCLLAVGSSGTLLQVGLLPARFEALGLPGRMSAGLRLATVQHWAAPLMPALRDLFGQDFEWRVEEAPGRWADTGQPAAFQLSVPAMRLMLQCRLADSFVPGLCSLLDRCKGWSRADVPMRLFAGTRLRMPVSEVLALQEGDVLLCDDVSRGHARQIRLYTDSVPAFRESQYLATVRADDGCVEHLAPGPWWDGQPWDGPPGPLVNVDVVSARVNVSARRCRRLTLGQCIEEWKGASWLDAPQLRIGGRLWAGLRPTLLARRPGYEIVSLQRPAPKPR